jgi:DnaJ-domain-containing protein 1
VSARFTAYLSERERDTLRERADELGTSENYLVRMALRSFLGLSTPVIMMGVNGASDS